MAKVKTAVQEAPSTQSIKSVRIQNFRCFEDITVDFKLFNSIVGENGSGKTTLLEAVHYALSGSGLSSRFDEQDFNNKDKDNIEIEVFFNEVFTAPVRDGWNNIDVNCIGIYLCVKRRDKSAPGQVFSDELVITHHVIPHEDVKNSGDGKYYIERQTGTPFRFGIRDLSFPLTLTNGIRSFYFAKNRDNQLKSGFNSTFERVTKEFNWRFRKELEEFKEQYLGHFLEIQKLIDTSLGKSKVDKALADFRSKVTSLLKNDYSKLEISIFNLEQPFDDSFFAMRDGLNQVEHAGMGSGVTMILAYCLLETISEMSKERILILIDEPELHLHPQLQFGLFKHMQAGSSQIILSTHSEKMVDISNWESIKRLDSNSTCYPTKKDLAAELEGISLMAHLNEINTFHQHKVLFFRENNEVLFARKCILVEGQSEQYGLQILADKLGYIDFVNHTVVCCNGKTKVPYYQMVCKAFGIPYFTIYDLDSKLIIEEENALIERWSIENMSYGFSKSFEHNFGTQNAVHKGSMTIEAITNIETSEIPDEIIQLFVKLKTF